MKLIICFIPFLTIGSVAQAKVLDCTDPKVIAKEAVEYHLTGAATGDLPLTCALKKEWNFFNPKVLRKPDPLKEYPKDWIWFETGKDSFSIESIKQVKKPIEVYQIKVALIVNKKKYKQTFTYRPWNVFHDVGSCGIVYSDDKPEIYRSDCKK